MKHLPESARAVLDSARHDDDAHDPSEAQLDAMLASLHAKLGYSVEAPPTAAPELIEAAAGPSRGVLSTKLLKLAVSIAALGGMVALVYWKAAPREDVPRPPVAAAVVETLPAEASPTPTPAPAPAPARDAELAAAPVPLPRAVAKKPAVRSVPSQSVKAPARATGPAVGIAVLDAPLTGATGIGVSSSSSGAIGIGIDSSSGAANAAPDPQPTAATAATADKPERIVLSDVVPTKRAPQKPTARALTDADELVLIDRAAKLVRDGDHTEALELLGEHSRKFPASQLKVERQGLSVLAQCGAGKLEQAKSARDAFLRDSGNAPLAARVRRACTEADKP
jgi:hypothetical protein